MGACGYKALVSRKCGIRGKVKCDIQSMDMSKTRQVPALIGLILITFAAAAIGGWATADAVTTWYPTLAKPAWNPPAWLFGPAWTLLYLLMAFAAWLVWLRRGVPGAMPALSLYLIQLVLNAAWSVVFFGLRQPGWAFVEIVALWVAIALTLRAFWKVQPAAGALLVPYLAWVTFASALNFTLWRMNS